MTISTFAFLPFVAKTNPQFAGHIHRMTFYRETLREPIAHTFCRQNENERAKLPHQLTGKLHFPPESNEPRWINQRGSQKRTMP